MYLFFNYPFDYDDYLFILIHLISALVNQSKRNSTISYVASLVHD